MRKKLRDIGVDFVGVVHESRYGKRYVGKPQKMHTSRGWSRYDGWENTRTGELSLDSGIHCASFDDDSTTEKKCEPCKCGYCYLNAQHTELLHALEIEAYYAKHSVPVCNTARHC